MSVISLCAIPHQLNYLIINNICSGNKCTWGNARKPNEQSVRTLEEYHQVCPLQKQRELAYKRGRSRLHCDWGTDSSCERARAASGAGAGAGGRRCPAAQLRQSPRRRRRRRPRNLQWSERATGEQRREECDWENEAENGLGSEHSVETNDLLSWLLRRTLENQVNARHLTSNTTRR